MISTGIMFYPLDPRAEDICTEDIAHHLTGMNRFNGGTSIPFSVAMHSIIGSRLCLSYWPEDYETAFKFLLHDAPEVYTNDFSRPIKLNNPELEIIERKISDIIVEKFDLDGPLMTDKVIEIDDNMLKTEFTLLMPWVPDGTPGKHLPYLGPSIFDMAAMSFERVKREYLTMFEDLSGKCQEMNALECAARD